MEEGDRQRGRDTETTRGGAGMCSRVRGKRDRVCVFCPWWPAVGKGKDNRVRGGLRSERGKESPDDRSPSERERLHGG